MDVVPEPSVARFHGNPAVGGSLDWEWARSRLQQACTYWMTTVGIRMLPHSRPVWGIWLDGRLLLTVGSHIHWSNLRENRRVEVNLESSTAVVILKGQAELDIDDGTRSRLTAIYNPKYNWELTNEQARGTIAVRPTYVLAWSAKPGDSADTFPAYSGRWSFPQR